MQLNFSVLTTKEFNTRKFWRKSFFVFYSLLICAVLIGSIIFLNSPDGTPFQLGEIISHLLFFVFLPAFLLYRFAYKKAGIFLLTLYLCLKPIDILIKGLLIFYLPFPFGVIVIGPLFLIGIFFYVLNWKLRKINKRLQLNQIYPEAYIQETSKFSNAASKNDLDIV